MTQRQIKVGIDIDGVLIDIEPKIFLEFCKKEQGWNTSYEVFTSTHSWQAATGGKTDLEIGKAFEKFMIQAEVSQKIIEGAHTALKQIGQIAHLYLITARVGALREVTEEFIKTHLLDVNFQEISMDNMDNKAARIIDFDLDYYIDDSHREIKFILKHSHIKTTLIPFPSFHSDYNWNDVDDERIHWLSAWRDVRPTAEEALQAATRKKAWQEIAELVMESKN